MKYVGHTLQNYCVFNSIIHQILCAHIPQQNNILKRIIICLTNTRTLMVHLHFLKYFWADAILTACHLINMVSFSVLNEKILFLVLYLEKRLFDLPQKDYRGVYFVQILEKKHDKLGPRAVCCVSRIFSDTKR